MARVRVGGGLGLVLLVLAIAASRAPGATFDLLGTHPDAGAQPTALGRTISGLTAFQGRIFVGYGDYNANTGPISVRAFDPGTDQFTPSMVSVPTEHIMHYREIGGKLYTPIIDTSVAGGGGSGYAVGTPDGVGGMSWQNVLPVAGIHMFDINSLDDGASLMMTGADPNQNGTAWYSANGGSNWSTSLTEPPPPNYFTRLYGLGKFQGKLWTEARHAELNGPGRINPPYSNVWDGTSWSHGPELLPPDGQTVWRPEVFGNHMVYLTLHNGWQASRLFKFDGTTAGQAYADPAGLASSLFRDFAVTEDYFYGLLSDGRMMQTRDLTNWTVFDTAPTSMRSIAILDNVLYMGNDNSQLFVYGATVPSKFVLGDLNGSGVRNNLDIHPFEVALADSAAFLASNPAIRDYRARGDINGDGFFNNLDIHPFEVLLAGNPLAVPEPSTFALLAIGAAVAAVRPWRRRGAAR